MLSQATKVLIFGAFFANLMFGFALSYLMAGNNLAISSVGQIFSLPFVTPPTDPSYSLDKVVPMIPSLTILIPALLAVIGLRLALYVGLHNIVRVIISYIQDASKGKPKFLDYVSTIEGIIGVGVIWAAINMFIAAKLITTQSMR